MTVNHKLTPKLFAVAFVMTLGGGGLTLKKARHSSEFTS